MQRGALVILLAAGACGEGAARDAGARDAAERDAGELDAAAADAGAGADSDVGSDVGSAIVALHLIDGGTITGEHIATYDHRAWWLNPSEETTFALFDERSYGAARADRSLTFVAMSGVASIEHLSGVPRYREFLRGEEIVIARSPLDGPAYVITGNESYHLEENGYGDFAWDLTIIDAAGSTFAGTGFANEDYYVWGREVRAPVAGTIVELVRDAPDRTPGPIEDPTAPNNLVGIHVAGAYTVYILHMQRSSIPADLQPGARVEEGDLLGLAGNSGVTIAPHVHFTVLWWDQIGARYWSVPSELADIYTSTSAAGAARRDHAVPRSGTWISSTPF